MSRKKYIFLESKSLAEVVFTAFGKTLGELFVNAALALETVQADLRTIRRNQKRLIILREVSIEELLMSFLQELVYLKDAESFIFCQFKVKELNEKKNQVEILAVGDFINHDKRQLEADIKAVTRHDLKIIKTEQGYETTLTLDV